MSTIAINTKRLTILVLAAAAATATLALALSPAYGVQQASVVTRVVELPRVVISAPREPAAVTAAFVELPRVVIATRRDDMRASAVAGAASLLQPAMSRQPN